MSEQGSTGYGPSRFARLQFGGEEDKFEAWETRFLGYMELNDLKKVLDMTAAPTEAADIAKNAKAYAQLIMVLDDTSLGLVMRDAKGDGRKAMSILREHYAGKGNARVVTLYTELTKLEKLPSDSMTDYILRAEKYATAIKSAGFVVPDPLLIAMVMKGLPSSYQPFVVVNTQSEITDFSKFKTNLRNYEETERARGGGDSSDSVMKMRGFQGGPKGGKGGGGKGGGFKGTCHVCKEVGHKHFDCPKKNNNNNNNNNSKTNNKKWCGICNNSSHNEANCRKKDKVNTLTVRDNEGGASGGGHSFQFMVAISEAKPDATDADADVIEKRSAVPVPLPVVEEAPFEEHCSVSLSEDVVEVDLAVLEDVVHVQQCVVEDVLVEQIVVDQVVDFDFESEDDVVGEDAARGETSLPVSSPVLDAAKSVCMKVSVDEKDGGVRGTLLVDTGATSHIIKDDSKFSKIDPTFKPQSHYVELADGTKHNEFALKRGDVEIRLKDKSGNLQNATLEKALYIPAFPCEIFSVSSAVEDDSTVVFRKSSSELILKNGARIDVKKQNKLYFLENTCTVSKVNAVKNSDVRKRKADLYLWHRILGHCNGEDVTKLEGIVDGMKILPSDKFQCETCILGKATSNRNRAPDERAKACMELVHTDLAGPINPVAREGFRYAISFVDDFSSATFVYFLKQKSDAPRALTKFLADARPYGPVRCLSLNPDLCPVQRLRSDNGGEYVSNAFGDILLKNSIKHEKSAPHSPHQNGTVERGWRTIFQMARCLLIESKLPRSLWTYAVMAAVYIRNRCYHQRTKQTPYFLLTGQKPDVSKMHVFGTICYPYNVLKTKLDDRSVKGVFLGYDKGSPAYIVYYPNNNKISTHRVVTFTDSIFPLRQGDGVVQNNLVLCEDDEDFPGEVFSRERRAVEPLAVVEVPGAEGVEENPEVVVPVVDVEDGGGRRNPPRVRNPPANLRDYVHGDDVDDVVGSVFDQDHENVTFCF